ncbi:MAG: RagB/SusD family nutrient uptake outer membrane protein [Prevotella sp.]|nr:RagB/SusD family nutrient uptake outer membrane protein [Prevotella sp.]
MKKYIYILSIAALGFTSCGSDYLETAPESAESTSVMIESAKNASLVINGMCRAMTQQYCSSQGWNGEGSIKTWYGNYPGNDFQKVNYAGNVGVFNQTNHLIKTSIQDYFAWFYYYKQIANANSIICNIDAAEGTEEDKAYVKAQALTFRAYSFFMLSQIYCHRWSDEQGKTDGIILRVDQSTGDQPLATLEETYDQVYSDLNEAISLFQKSGKDRGMNTVANVYEFYKPNIDVAYAVYARAAVTKQDWQNAAKYAALAKANHPIMSNDQYADGMFNYNTEWIWGVYEGQEQTLYYYSFYAYQGSNSSSSQCRTYPTAISKELIDQIPETDVRRDLYLVPTDEELAECNAAGRSTKKLYKRAFADYGTRFYSTSLIYAYAQMKHRCEFTPGGGSFPLFRSAEMYYIEAEADYHLGKVAEAQQLLYDANKDRDPMLEKSTKTGEDLLAEIKLYRRFDLWGEGYDWFDYKRWGDTIVRKTWADGGSFLKAYVATIGPKDANQWTWVIPERETMYNGAFKNGTTTASED